MSAFFFIQGSIFIFYQSRQLGKQAWWHTVLARLQFGLLGQKCRIIKRLVIKIIILHATWTFYELHFISIIVTKKGFLLNYKVQNIDHRHKAKSSFFTFYKYFLYLSVCQFAMKARRLHFSSYMFCFVVFFFHWRWQNAF